MTIYDDKPPADWEAPDWGNKGRAHDWKNYISPELEAMWESFTPEQKMAIANSADYPASREEWD